MYNNIDHYPFAAYADCDDIEQLARSQGLTRYNSWMLPQLVASFGRWQLVGRDVKATLQRNVGTDPHAIGIWRVCVQLRRSLLVASQVANPEYSSLTPLVLLGFRRYQSVPYSSWRQSSHLDLLVPADLLAAATCDVPVLSRDRLLAIRAQGLLVKSGAAAGTSRSSTSTWSLQGIADTEIAHLPRLACSMLCQIWTAHPSLRTQAAILDSNNWDLMPDALIDVAVTAGAAAASTLLPWQ
jgi:hypothetical protein